MWNNIKGAFQKYPWIILIGGGVIALYFLWPRRSNGDAPPAPVSSRDDYATQLAAQTALAQSQLASQTALGISEQQTDAALELAGMEATSAGLVAQWQSQGAIGVAEAQASGIRAQSIANYNTVLAAMSAQNFGTLADSLIAYGAQGVEMADIRGRQVESLFGNLGAEGLVRTQGNLKTWLTQLLGGTLAWDEQSDAFTTAQSSASKTTYDTGGGGGGAFNAFGWWVPAQPRRTSSFDSAFQQSQAWTRSKGDVSFDPAPGQFDLGVLADLFNKLLQGGPDLPPSQLIE